MHNFVIIFLLDHTWSFVFSEENDSMTLRTKPKIFEHSNAKEDGDMAPCG